MLSTYVLKFVLHTNDSSIKTSHKTKYECPFPHISLIVNKFAEIKHKQ